MMEWFDRILFEDGEALVIDKPAGLAVHPGPATPRSLEDHLDDLKLGFQRPPMPVHRLDRDTSGCLLLARNPKALKRFAGGFEAGLAQKTYLAILDGLLDAAEGAIDLPLVKRSTKADGWRIVVDARGKPSRTRWRLLDQQGGRALVAFMPETGRTHQIRVHAAEGLGAPVLGDPVYGGGPAPGGAMLLHARALVLPRDGKPPIAATAPVPASFAAAGFADADRHLAVVEGRDN